jgi:hypothetical protein
VALTVCTWFWGTKYTTIYVERLYSALQRNLQQSFRFMVFTEGWRKVNFSNGIERHSIVDLELTQIKGCFARLRMFDPHWQRAFELTERIVCLDLDTVITGNLDPLFDRDESFVILQGANAANPCPYTACVFMLRAGTHPELWTEFSLHHAESIARYEFPDDQGWMHHKVRAAAAWHVGHRSGIYAFHKPGWPRGTDNLPRDARMVAFVGFRDPAQFTHLPWIKKFWR